MVTGTETVLSNGLRLLVDWISFTLFEPCTPSDAINFMGYNENDFILLPSGRNGYKSRLRHCSHSIDVLFDGSEGMGVHVDVTGSAVSDLVDHFCLSRLSDTPFGTSAYETVNLSDSVVCDLLSCISKIGKMSRIDIAIDDIGTNYYSLRELSDIVNNDLYVSKFRTVNEMIKRRNRQVSGRTIYFGSRKSDYMLRIYDKQLEQNEKLISSGSAPLEYTWVRWELEIKDKRAQKFVDLIAMGMSITDLTLGLLSNSFRVIESDASRRDRCSTSLKWQEFICSVAKLSLYQAPPLRTLDDTKNWMMRQVAPSLAAVVMASGGTLDFINDLLECGSLRLRPHQYVLIQKELGKLYDFE